MQLETPYDLNLEQEQKLLVGFYYQQEVAAAPLSFVHVGQPYDTYSYTKVGTTSKWKANNSTDHGNLSIQCIVEKDSYPDYRLAAYNLTADLIVPVGGELPFSMVVSNRGIKQIEANGLGVNVLVDGQQVTTVSNDTPFVEGYCTVTGTAPVDGFEAGDHVLTVVLESVDGQPLEEPISQDFQFVAYRQVLPRQKHLVEQLTSTYCTYCPRGVSVLSRLTSQRDDVIWVGIHGNLGSGVDPFHCKQADSIMVYLTGGSIAYPSGAFNRSTGWDDDVSIVSGLGYSAAYFDLAAQLLGNFFDYLTATMPTYAEIDANCTFNEETRMATVAVMGKMHRDFEAIMGDDARLTVYVVEDSLVAQQLNEGTWVPDFRHNGVFRMAPGSVKGQPLNKVQDDLYKNVYRFEIPAAWKWENLRVVAFISRPITNYVRGFTDMYVNNAEIFSFKVSDAVEEINVDPNAVPVNYYDVMGREHSSLQPGINIIRMSDGTTRKILIP